MIEKFDEKPVTLALINSDKLAYDALAFRESLLAALDQDHGNVEVIVVDDRGDDAKLPLPLPLRGRTETGAEVEVEAEVGAGVGLPGIERVTHLPGSYANRAAMYNTALRAAKGEFFVAIYNAEQQIVLRRSAVRTLVMAAARGRGRAREWGERGGREHEPSMVYADYERIDADGKRVDVNLLDWHAGRLRDTTDFGPVQMFRTDHLRDFGGWNEQYQTADAYAVRLQATERGGARTSPTDTPGHSTPWQPPPKSTTCSITCLRVRACNLRWNRL